jgi:formylglycine-generating enzyme required for sulfatase activity
VTSLIATFTWTGVSVTAAGAEQESGTTANDFTDPVTYTVTADDGTTQDYMVTVTIAPPRTEKAITAYSFTAADNTELNSTVTGTISGTDISVTLPYGTDVTSLVADFTTTGVSVTVNGTEQESGVTPNDFTDPVIYMVTAEDSSTIDYTVTITPAASEGTGFGNESNPGDTGVLTLPISSEALTMIYAQNQASITFPTDTDDDPAATLTTLFWMGETEVTNAVMAAVLQWAYENGRFSDTVSDPNGLDTATVKHGGQELLDLDSTETWEDCRINYDGSGVFSAESGYQNNPVTDVSWYGAVMFCNWLTEMRDGNTDNVVYTNIDTSWQDDETVEHPERNGYRLPSSDEWEYTARYRGSDSTNTVIGYSNPYFTKGNSASGAAADYTDESACRAVAVYDYANPDPYDDEQPVKSLGSDSANTLGLYDMSGNVSEWCFTENGSFRIGRGGSWISDASRLQVGFWDFRYFPDYSHYDIGFRLCRTAD